MDYIPLANLIIAAPIEEDEVSPGGIFIPEQSRRTLNEAVVIKTGESVSSSICPGVTIVFAQHSETRIKVNGKHYVCVEESNVMMYKKIAALQDAETAASSDVH